jgi:hypothetical protein
MKIGFTVPFIILTFVCGIVLIILGMLLAGFGGFYEALVDNLCAAKGTEIENDYRVTVDKYVCSKDCPCPQGPGLKYQTYWEAVSTTRLAESNRTATYADMTT